MKKLKSVWVWIVGAISAVAGFFWYFLARKDKQNKALKEKIALAETEKDAALIESEIDYIKEQRKPVKKELKELDQIEKELILKKEKLKNDKKTNKEIEKYWNE